MTTETKTPHGRWKELAITFDDATARLPDALKKEGFGVITQIDLQETFKAKLGADFRRYRIFGACNPAFAHAAVTEDPRVGVLLPCNVVLYEDDRGRAVIGAVDPMQTLGGAAVGSNATGLASIAREVGERLDRVLASLAT
ncbi:MAG: DUF302 domain-containing protein [Deltaproteobacteria bacterium]|nr:DUF302 domain-containing protein [Deltaproteobacteria bacterium]